MASQGRKRVLLGSHARVPCSKATPRTQSVCACPGEDSSTQSSLSSAYLRGEATTASGDGGQAVCVCGGGGSSAPPDLDEVVAPARDEAHGLQGRAGRRGCREDRAGREGGGPRDRVAADLVRVEPLDGPAVVGLARQDAHPAIGGRASQAEAVLHRAPCDRVDGALVLAALVHLPPLARRVLLPHEDLTVVPRRSRGRRNRRLWAGTRARPQPLPGKQPLPSEGPPLGPRGGAALSKRVGSCSGGWPHGRLRGRPSRPCCGHEHDASRVPNFGCAHATCHTGPSCLRSRRGGAVSRERPAGGAAHALRPCIRAVHALRIRTACVHCALLGSLTPSGPPPACARHPP